MKLLVTAAALAASATLAHAQSCEGGLYLNPQVIRGEASTQTEAAVKELADFLRPTGLPLAPIVNVKSRDEVAAAVRGGHPPCWVYGNPVVGLASGLRPVAVNREEIRAAVLVMGDMGDKRDAKPVDVARLPADEQRRVRDKLKSIACFGIRSGVTTALVQSEKLCGSVVEVMPQQGLGQSYLPTKAAFEWRADRWVGLVTRLQSAESANLKSLIGVDERIHMAQLYVVGAANPSWGYGLYARSDLPADVLRRVHAQFAGLKSPHPMLARALDVGASFEFAALPEREVLQMRQVLGIPGPAAAPAQ